MTDIRELKDNEPLEVITISHQLKMSTPLKNTDKKLENKLIYTKVLTDGIVVKKDKKPKEKITEYYFDDNEKFNGNADFLRKKDLYFKNHSYVITYLIAKQTSRDSSSGDVEIVKNISIYLKNRMDIKTLKKVKRIVKEINRYNINHSPSLIPYGLEEYDNEKCDGNVYVLKPRKKVGKVL